MSNKLTLKLFSISIYYNRRSWSSMLMFISKKLISLSHIISRSYYVIHFENSRGDSIVITFQLNEADARLLLNTFSIDIYDYINTNPSDVNAIQKPNMLFMDFPNNSIQYGIQPFFPILLIREINNKEVNFWQQTSDILLREFSKDHFDIDNLLGAYLNICILFSEVIRCTTNILLDEFLQTSIMTDDDDFFACYSDNKIMIEASLIECQKVINGNRIEGLEYLNDFANLFILLSNTSYNPNPIKYNEQSFFHNILFGLRVQLGITSSQYCLIEYFILRLFAEIN